MDSAEKLDKSIDELLHADHYTPEELARLLDMTVEVVRTACHTHDLRCQMIDHDIVNIRREDALAWLNSR